MKLIYFPINALKPSGGPSGYLYNLKNELDYIENHEIVFLPEDSSISQKEKIKSIFPKRILDFRKAFRFTKMYTEKKQPSVDLNLYEVIHFHRTDDLYRCREALDNYKGKVILTSHTPCARFQELLDMLNSNDKRMFAKKLETLKLIDEYAFERADYIIFPCKEAEEPYYNTWKEYEKIRKGEKYKYLPTGIVGCQAKIDRAEYRKKYGIPENAFVISYAGRHNEIKGYADLKKLGEKMLGRDDIYFLVAGKEEPLEGLKNEYWIEVGWTNDPHSLIAASDVFVLPNHETYFDLILLEVLSLGVPAVISRTGGNKYFEKFNLAGIRFFDDLEGAEKQIFEIKETSIKDINIAKQRNIALFEQEFSVKKFAINYINLITQIANE